MKKNHVLIVGLGAISAAGGNAADTLGSFSLKKRNAGAVTLFDTELKYPVFEVNKIPDEYYLEGQRTLSLALCAVAEALNDAQLVVDLPARLAAQRAGRQGSTLRGNDLSKYRLGISMGTTVASQLNDLDFYKSYRNTGSASMTSVDRYLKGNLAEFILRRIGARGPALTVVNACSSGTDAIGIALSWLDNDLCDIAIAGGADELNRIPLCGFGSLGIVSMDLCAPFDRDRNGLNLGEGAGILILETKESARKRGITSDLFLAGYGSSSDAYHLTAPHPEGKGLKTSLQKALIDAGVKPEEVSFVNAHGTATPDNDLVEGKVLAEIFGTDLKMLSTKGFTGHTLGAAGGLEAVFTAAGLRERWVPASAGFKNKDEAIPLIPVREKTAIKGRYAVSTSLAFGGNNAALVIGRI